MTVNATRLHRALERQFDRRATISRPVDESRSDIGSAYDEDGNRMLTELHADVKCAFNLAGRGRGEVVLDDATLGVTNFYLTALGSFVDVRENDVLTLAGEGGDADEEYNIVAVGPLRQVAMTRFRLEREP